ncbi:MAG: VWA-like domain-containing protein [Litoreibacter sp.]|nr:VWA-like domain-containing protein [Litoreibacter sp.]MCY4335281.1 VWA-like domain-containing protein [Litoreibacter sp.]
MTHSARAQRALALLPEIDPAIAMLGLWCSFRDSPERTATEGEVIRVGPEFPRLPISEQTGLIAHHILHVALRHSARRSEAQQRYGAGFRAESYDLACDALVNEALLKGGHALPRPAVRAGDIVALLPPNQRPENVLSEWDCDRLYAAIAAQSPGRGTSEEGEIERYAATQGFEPDLQGSDPETAEPEVWAGRVDQALSAGRNAGSGIGAALNAFGDLPRARVPWEIRLRRMLHKALSRHPRQSHRRPARTWLARDALARQGGGAQPVFEPGQVRQDKRPRLVVALDTSSSIDARALNLFAAEAISAIKRSGAEAYLLGFDTEVHFKERFERADAIKALQLRRGGGTDLDPVLSDASALDPSFIVVLTDLDAPMRIVPLAPVIWAVPAEPSVRPGFGEVLVLNDLPV